MFAGITSLLWGSSAPAPTLASEVPAAIEDDLCKMEVGSDTGYSDEEMVHLPKPNSDGEEDWVVVTEGRSGKKQAPKKKKQGVTSMDLDAKVEERNVLKSGDQFLAEDPEKNMPMTRRGKVNYSRMMMRDPLATPSDLVDQDIGLLCNMLNDKRRKPSEVEGVTRLLSAKLKDRREELEKELHFNKEHEARAAERELKKEEQRQETRLLQKAAHPVEHRRLSRKNIQKSNAARLMSTAGNGRLRRSDRLQPRHASGANNIRKRC